jgi:RNA polymerase sigma factor (sigma-70 family)
MANGQSEWFKPRLAEGLDARTAQQALADLPPEHSELIVMRIWGEMTFTRIAEITGESVSTVHAHYMTALETLRKKMVTHVRQTTDE